MNRYVRAATAALVLAGGLGSVGCVHRSGGKADGRNDGRWVDPSWPDRYTYAARQAVIAPFAQQVANGHFTNQVIWNWYFEPGTDVLNGAGMEKLDSIARSTPAPDTKLFVQAARDVAVTPDNTGQVRAMREELTTKRAAAIHRYMATQPGPVVTYDVSVVDMPTPGIYAPFASNSFRGQTAGYVGGLRAGAGGVAGFGGGGGVGMGAGVQQAPAGTGVGTTPAGTTGY